jgi:integrase
MNLQIARAFLFGADERLVKRTWNEVFDALIEGKHGPTQVRWQTARKEKPFDLIRHKPLIQTTAEDFFAVLKAGRVSTNLHLRRLHNFAVDMDWLPRTIIPKRQWPPVLYGEKRAIIIEEHERIVANEGNRERRDYYRLCWHLGASQGDIANLKGEDVDWENKTISFFRRKTRVPVVIHLGREALDLLKDLPSQGALFPYLSRVRSGDRAAEFKQRCRALGIEGVSLHSYRYAWAERAKCCGYPERFAQEALGHGSKAVARAYAKKAQVKLPSLEE